MDRSRLPWKKVNAMELSNAVPESPGKDDSTDTEITFCQRLVSACCGALLTSLLVTPLDVVKVRQQAAGLTTSGIFPAVIPQCSHYQYCNGIGDVMCSKADCKWFQKPIRYASPSVLPGGAFSSIGTLVKEEGLFILWSGLPPTLVMSVPSTVLYFAAYDSLKGYLRRYTPQLASDHPVFCSAISGASARVLAATAVSPLELARTQMQSSQAASKEGTFRRLLHTLRTTGVGSLYRGLFPTLARDVPFSAMYWPGYEFSRNLLANHLSLADSKYQSLHSLISGASAGMVAAILTHPFDVVKTRHQVHLYSTAADRVLATEEVSLSQTMKTIVKNEGVTTLYSGLWARVARIAPSCAIMITCYEVAKKYFAEHQTSSWI